MSADLQTLVSNINAVLAIGLPYTDLDLDTRINLYQNISYRRLLNLLFRETTDINNELVFLLGLSSCIQKPLIKISNSKDIIGPYLLKSINHYPTSWENALEAHKENPQVIILLARYSEIPQEMKRLDAHTMDLVSD